ncbi:MAG TPA: PaaI family thioesterase [Candidatus Acidoferrum sp.]|nr:PaaI family thioesterase [Candidatus Acidoferrum sp.]
MDDNRQLVERIFQEAKFVRSLGIELTGVGSGWCETKVNVTPALCQQHGFAHAGVVMTLADHTCGGAAGSTVSADKDVITVENKISFLRPASGSVLFCRAEVLRAGKNLIFVEAEVTADGAKGRVMVAKASSTLAVILRTREAGEARRQ